MSQQMEFEESSRQRQEPPFGNYESGYRDPFMSTYSAQKISSQGTGSSGASAGQCLALAIVSLCLLVPISGIIFGISLGAGGPFGFLGALIALGLICLTI